MEETVNHSEIHIKEKSKTALLWLGIVSITMLFAAFTSAYIVSMGSKNWLEFELPFAFLKSTAAIVLSSITMVLAVFFGKKGAHKNSLVFLVCTLFLGIVFSFFQIEGWNTLTAQGVYFTGPSSSASGSYLFVLTALHLAHLVAAFLALLITVIRSLLGKYSSQNYSGLKRCGIYWHFLSLLWVYLLCFLEFI